MCVLSQRAYGKVLTSLCVCVGGGGGGMFCLRACVRACVSACMCARVSIIRPCPPIRPLLLIFVTYQRPMTDLWYFDTLQGCIADLKLCSGSLFIKGTGRRKKNRKENKQKNFKSQ